MHKVSHHLDRFMRYLVVVFLLLTAGSICYATSNVTFRGNGYDISVFLSDEDCKVVGLNVSGDNPNIISVGANELTAFSKAESDCKKKTIHLVVPATKSHPHFELKSTSKKGHATLGEKKVRTEAFRLCHGRGDDCLGLHVQGGKRSAGSHGVP